VWMSEAGLQIGDSTGQVTTTAGNRIEVESPGAGVLAYTGDYFIYYAKQRG